VRTSSRVVLLSYSPLDSCHAFTPKFCHGLWVFKQLFGLYFGSSQINFNSSICLFTSISSALCSLLKLLLVRALLHLQLIFYPWLLVNQLWHSDLLKLRWRTVWEGTAHKLKPHWFLSLIHLVQNSETLSLHRIQLLHNSDSDYLTNSDQTRYLGEWAIALHGKCTHPFRKIASVDVISCWILHFEIPNRNWDNMII